MVYLCYAAILLHIACLKVDANYRLAPRFEWKQIDFEFPNDSARAKALASGEFIPQNNLILGVERWRNKLFITLPRWRPGTAATLAYVDLSTQEKSPKLKPYPNWGAHKLRENNGVPKITSVYRLNVDVCDRLWLIDTGLSDILGKTERLHDPKIQVYDLTTDQLLRDYTLPKHVLKEDSYFGNIIADVNENNCDGAFAYAADFVSNSLVVLDWLRGESYRVTHPFFHFDPLDTNYNIGGVNFQWMVGLIGLSLSSVQPDGFRTLYFNPMSSSREFAVSTSILRNKTIASNSYHQYKMLGSRGPNTQSIGSSLDEATGVLFFTLFQKNAIGCWNTNNPEYSTDTNAILVRNDVTMIFLNDVKVDKTGYLWILSDRLSDFIENKLNYSDVNFRIFVTPAKEIVRGTVCDGTFSSSRATATDKYQRIRNFGDDYNKKFSNQKTRKFFIPAFTADYHPVTYEYYSFNDGIVFK